MAGIRLQFYDPSELRDRPVRPVNENLAKITERIRQNRETNSNLATLDKAVAERAKNISSDNGAEDKAETVSEPVEETADTAEMIIQLPKQIRIKRLTMNRLKYRRIKTVMM